MDKLKDLLRELCALPTVSGREKESKKSLFALADKCFDEAYEDSFGNLVLVKKSTMPSAPRLMIDAHFDEVGMMVSQVHEGGFLSVAPIGGLDMRVLGATQVVVYGKQSINGVLTSTPPHLLTGDKALPKISDIYVDTGLDKEKLEGLVSAGDYVGFASGMTELLNNRVASKGLDDKACACAIFDMASRIDKTRLKYDIYAVISAQEETGKSGARFVAYDISPDLAIITDVCFARGEGIETSESVELGQGACVDVSACTSIPLTRAIMKMLDERKIPHQRMCEPSRTYTNNEAVSISGKGVRTALLGIPLSGMHTPSEIVSLEDIKSLSDILLEIAYEEGL